MTDEPDRLKRVERLLAFMLLDSMEDASQLERTVRLNEVGFMGQEIADLLGTSPQTVRQNLYTARGKAKKAPSKTAAVKNAGSR